MLKISVRISLRLILFYMILCMGHSAYSQQSVRYLGIENGLSNNAVTCIFKDHYGFMWMGTYDGLNRYDGDRFDIYRNIWGDSTSLTNNHINAITETDNMLFVGTQKGISCYDYSSATFSSLFFFPFEQKNEQKINVTINALLTTKSGTVFIGADNIGLLSYNNKLKKCQQIPLSNHTESYTVQALGFDDKDNLLVFVKNSGLFILTKYSNHLINVNAQLKMASCILEDNRQDIWIGTENGLFELDSGKNVLHRFGQNEKKLSSDNIVDLKLDVDGNLWVATNGGGVNILNLASGELKFLVPGKEQGTLRSGAVSGILIDNESRKWIATLRGGINIVDDEKRPFQLFTHDPFNKNSVINNFILSFCEDENDNVWIGTDGGGLSYWDVKQGTYQSFVHSSAPSSLVSNFVVSILKDFKNQIWVATFSGGIDAFVKRTGQFKHYNCFNTQTKSDDKNLWKLFEDAGHNLWAGSTRGGALYLYNRSKDQFELFDPKLTNIHTLFQDHSGNLWAGNYTQLIKIDRINKSHQYYYTGYAIRAIAQGMNNMLWIGTEGGGLLLFDPKSGAFVRYTQNDGLPSNTILNILIDNKNNLWCSTYNGLTMYNTASGKFLNYDAADGLQSNQFNYNAALKLKSGQMLFGGIKGFNLFNPDSIKMIDHKPDLRLTDLKINNVLVAGRDKYTNGQPVVSLRSIKIPYDQATLAVNYTALEYSFPDKINYAYFLDGWDHNWNNVGNLKTAYYTRLSEGTYTLRIKATSTRGIWMNKQIAVIVTVVPPWYRTWWAYSMYILVGGLVSYQFWLYRKRQSKLKFEINDANQKIEREKELNEKKLAFFTNVSHEFRTPLTLIINPIKDLLKKNSENSDDLNIIYRNARRLLGLVDHLLLFRKTESENNSMKVNRIDFVNLCNEVFMCFTQQAKIKQINFAFRHSAEQIEVYADHEKIEISLFNLISNAVKFTPDGGSILVSIDEDETNVYFRVADNGIGISDEVGDRLFGKFYQVKENNYFKTGFGIGLYLVKVFIENHSGSIEYHNNCDSGTTFVLRLPKGKSHFTGEQLTENLKYGQSHFNDMIDHDNKDMVIKEKEETIDLELMISNKQSLLVIDDNDQIRSYVKKLFVADYLVYEANNGQTGLELVKRHLPDLIISDVVMNEMNGVELCRAVKLDSSINHIPIILLTGDATQDLMLKAMEEGAMDFISKPFDKDILIAKVKSILRGKTELQNYFYNEITLKNNSRNISEEHKNFLYNCIGIIETHLTDAQFDVYMLAQEMGISYPTLFKRIKTFTGQSVNSFIRFIRLRKAAELLIHTNCNVNEAAYRVGFNDMKYFREHFHKQFDTNPSEFVKKHRANFQISYRMDQLQGVKQ